MRKGYGKDGIIKENQQGPKVHKLPYHTPHENKPRQFLSAGTVRKNWWRNRTQEEGAGVVVQAGRTAYGRKQGKHRPGEDEGQEETGAAGMGGGKTKESSNM